MWRLKRGYLKSSIPDFPEKSKLSGSWDCSVFSPKKTVIKILAFLFPGCEFVCTQLLAAACSSCLLALLLALGSPLISLSSSSTDCFSSGLYTFHVGIFLQSPLSALAQSLHSIVLLFLTLHACRFLQSQSSAFFCFFIFCPCTSEPRIQMCFTELGLATGSWPWSPASAAASGEKTEIVQSTLGWHQPGIGSAGVSYSTLWI